MTQDSGQSDQGNDPGTGQPATGASSLPDPTTKPLEGKVEAEKSGYASELVAYRVMDHLGSIIANRVETALTNDEGARILLVDDLGYTTGGLALAEINAQASFIKSAFEERETAHNELLDTAEAPTSALPSLTMQLIVPAGVVGLATTAASFLPQIPKAVGAVADLLAYFRSNYKVSGWEMSVSKQALLSSTVGSLAGRRLATFIPGFYAAGDSPLLSTLTELAHWAARLKTERDFLAEELPQTGGATGGGAGGNGQEQPDEGTHGGTPQAEPPNPERLAQVAKAVRETDAALLAYEGFRTAWTTPSAMNTQGGEGSSATATTTPATTPETKPADGEASKLAQALIQEGIDKHEITHLLWVSNFSAGGESTVRDRLLRKDRVGFMGGAAAGYVLAGTDGRIVAADTFAQFGVIGGNIEEFTEGNNFEDIDYKPDYSDG
jgi:hypothetical protein